MSELERHISRYLDREMSADEERSFLRAIDADPIARETLRRMEEVRTVARLFPTLTAPSAASESRLFRTLFAEEDEGRRRAAAVPPVGPGTEEPTERRRRGLAAVRFDRMVPALLVLLLIGAGIVGIDRVSDGGTNGTEGKSIAGMVLPERVAGTTTNGAATNDRVTVTEVEAAGLRVGGTPVPRISLPATPSHPNHSPMIDGMNEEEVISSETEQAYADIDLNDLPDSNPVTPQNQPGRSSDTMSSRPPIDSPIDYSGIPHIAEAPPSSDGNERSRFAGSLHFGVAAFSDGGTEMLTAQDMNLRVDGRLGDRHRVSVVVGNAPILVSGTQTSMPVGIVVDPDDEKGVAPSGGIEITDIRRPDHEIWAGLGYGYAIYQTRALSIEAGVNLGAGEHSLRVGLELPARIRVADRVSVDVVPFVNRVTPYDQEIAGREINRYSHIEERTPTLTSFGAQLGISFDIGE